MSFNGAMNTASAPLLADTLGAPTMPAPSAPPRSLAFPIAILGVPFDHVTIDGAIDRVDQMIASRRPHYIVTANVDFLVQAHRDVELRRILIEADLVLCDGTPLVWASRWLGNALPERVAGSDLAPGLLRRAAEKGHRVFLLGAAEGVAAEATAKLKATLPTLNIVGHYSPPYADLLRMDHDEIVRRIRAAKPDILFVSFGCPKQEKWIAMHHRTLGVPVSIGVGATIDFLAGRVKRAPEWMRDTGTEWIYRLVQEPRRLYKRYAKDLAVFVPTLAKQCLRLPRARANPGEPREISFGAAEWRGVDGGHRLTREALERHESFWTRAQQRSAHTLLDVSKVTAIDGTGVAFLIRWKKALHARGHELVLLAPSAALRRSLRSLRLADYFLVATDLAQAAQQASSLIAQPTVQRDGLTRSLAWCGEIVAANADDVWRMTTDHVKAFAAANATLVIIDLSRLRFIDSSGAALMMRLKKWTQSVHAEVLFANPQPNIRNVLRLTRMDQLLLEGDQ
jgi:N-acetylglucosaminyldiphosphoundecaprenol N-acetyl-beta-D-mannosaminyltransferase